MLSEASRVPAAPALRPSMAPRASAEGRGLPDPIGDEPSVKKLGGLVLTRHLGESIMVGDDVEVEVVGIKAGTVRVKIVAPRSIPVHRREVFDAIQEGPAPAGVAAIPPETGAAPPRKPHGGLVLTRSLHQSIMIGREVEIAIVEIRPTVVKVKISAPRIVAVHRREVYEAIRDGRA